MTFFWTNPTLQSNAPGPRVQTLQEFLGLSPSDARKLKRAMNDTRGYSSADKAMDLANQLMEASGIEAINGEYHVDNYYFDIVALYVNTGDTYNPTLLYETETGRFIATSWGDWVEKNQEKYKIR